MSYLFLFFFLQPPPTYEESIRQSVELPYNIFSPGVDILHPQTFYSNAGTVDPTDTDRQLSSDASSSALPTVWCWDPVGWNVEEAGGPLCRSRLQTDPTHRYLKQIKTEEANVDHGLWWNQRRTVPSPGSHINNTLRHLLCTNVTMFQKETGHLWTKVAGTSSTSNQRWLQGLLRTLTFLLLFLWNIYFNCLIFCF